MPLRRIRSDEEAEAPTDEPKRDVVDAVGIPHETRLGRRVEETCFITDQTVTQALQPAQLNGGNLVDIFQTREDDFDAVETMEVSYTSSSGEKVQELVFAENSKQKTFTGPRILVSASRVNTMHRAISVLSRKVDNLTTTLRVCREHYYKELFSLRHGRQPSEEHEKFWFTPQAYQDTVSIQELRKRFGTEQEDLRKREQEVRELRAKLRQIDSIAEERLEKLVTRKTLPELFNWMRDMNAFREADFDLHIQVVAQELILEGDANKAPDLEKEQMKNKLEDLEFEVDNLQRKLMEAQVVNQGLTQLLTERKAEPIIEARIEEDLESFFSGPSSAATPVRSKEPADSQRRRSQTTEDTLSALNKQAETAAELAEAEEKIKQLKALADAWEREAREQSRKNLQLVEANKDAAYLHKQKDQAEKDAARAHQQKAQLQKQVEKFKGQIEALRADGMEVESVKMSEEGDLHSRRNTIEEEEITRAASKGRLKPAKASSRAASKSPGKGSPKGSGSPRSPRGPSRSKSKGRKAQTDEKDGKGDPNQSPDPFQLLNSGDAEADEPANLSETPDPSVSFGSEAFPRADTFFGGDSTLGLPELAEVRNAIGVSRDATLEMSSYVSLGLEDTDYTTEGTKELRDASVQTLMTTEPSPPRWLVLQDENNAAWVSNQEAINELMDYTKFKLLQWSVHFIKSEEPDVLKISAALAALDQRMNSLGRSAAVSSPSGRPGRLSTAVQRIQRMQQGNWQKVVEMEEARKSQVALNQLPNQPPQPKQVRPLVKPTDRMKRLAAAARRFVSPSGAAISGAASLAAAPSLARRDSKSLPPMQATPSPEERRIPSPPGHATTLPPMEERIDYGELESGHVDATEWPRQVTENLDLLSSGSDRAASSRPSISEDLNREGSFNQPSLFENESHFESRMSKDVPPVEAVHDWTQGLPYALRQEAKPGHGLFTTPAKPLKVNNKEKWMPKVSVGGFSNLDTPSLISGHLDRFQEEFEAAQSSTD